MIISTEEGDLEFWELKQDLVFKVRTGKLPFSLLIVS